MGGGTVALENREWNLQCVDARLLPHPQLSSFRCRHRCAAGDEVVRLCPHSMHWASHSESAAKHNAPWCGVAGQYGRRLARAASVNIDCGRVATKSLPAWPEAPTFAWACGHGRIHSLQDPHMVGVFIRSVVGAASDWDAALDNVAAKCWTGGEIRVAAPLET